MSSIVKLCLLTFTVMSALLKAQVNPSYTVFSGSLQGTGSGAIAPANTIILPVTNKSNYQNTILRETNKSAKLRLKLDAGNDYVKSTSAAWVFTATVVFDYKFLNTGPSYQRTLAITNNSPELLKIDDVLANFVTPSQGFTLTILSVDLKDGLNINITSGLLFDFLSNNLRLTASLHREYGVDVRMATSSLMSNKPLIKPVAITGRLVTFSWQPSVSVPYPNYELQILKLYNSDESLKNDLNQIKTTVDWSKALSVETQSHKTSIQLTMAEGTGYYTWRVRPLGTYFSGGAANSENHGEWSHCINSGTIALNKNSMLTNNPNLYTFYLTDPDENINWIYNRVFTEGDDYNKTLPTGIKSSEGITYADGLQRVKQSQKYNSSEDTRLISQTVSDYSGRAALNSIPVPTIGGLNGYKNDFLKNTSNELYTAKQFDEDTKLNDPDRIQDVNTAYTYYSDYSTSGAGVNNSNVPDAEGYPFKRTLYKSDGSNRVVEESGVGKTHALGSQTNNRGRTTRMYYAIPSDDELIRIFGDEAPQSESVIKTTTIDQNNVVSISYTSKEGKTIATALSSFTTQNLSQLSGSAPLRSVTNAINQNVNTGGKIVASKRISVLNDSTTVYVSYTTENLPMATAGCLSAGCNYEMRFYMVDLQNNKTYMSDADMLNTAVTNFTTAGDITDFPDNWGLIEVGGTQTIVPGGSSLQNELTLNSGEYIFIKEFYSTNSPDYAENLANLQNDKTRLILNAIAAQMQDVSNPIKRTSFSTWMSVFKAMVTDWNTANPVYQTADFINHLCLGGSTPPGFEFPKAPDFDIGDLITGLTPGTSEMVITTKCCGSMNVQLPNNAICYACEGSPDTQYSTPVSINTMTLINKNTAAGEIIPYGLEDFENNASWAALDIAHKRYAISEIVEREFIEALKAHMDEENISYDDLWKMTPGFSFSSLNFMLTNMLISRYYTGNVIESGGVWYEAVKDENGNFVLGSPVVDYSVSYPHNYDCKKLWESWIGSVSMQGSFDLEGGNNNVVKEYDNAEGPLATLLSSINTDNWPPHLQDMMNFLKNGIGKVINKFSNSRDGSITPSQMAAETSITGTFLFLVKPSYAAIIDGKRLPAYISHTSSTAFPKDYFDFTGTPNPLDPNIYTSVQTGTYTHQNVPQLCDDYGNLIYTNCGGNNYTELTYPYTLKPEWMFKYFVYNVFENNSTSPSSFIDDDDYLIPNQVITDLASCYNEPFSYLPSSITGGTLQASDLCRQTAKPTFTLGASTSTLSFVHLNWSASERKEFYTQIKGAARCFTTKGISTTDNYYEPSGSLPACQTKTVLVSEAKAILAERTADCQDMAPRIKSALIKELELSCYTIVSCPTTPVRIPGEITMTEIDLMADAVINDALQLIAGIDAKLSFVANNTSACTSSTLISTMGSYSNNQCDLPACSQENCVEIFLYEDNTLGRSDSRTLKVKYFSDCDQKILDMLEQGTFLPDIPPPSGVNCNKPLKAWQQCTGTTTNCSPDYEEKTGCPASDFKRYSKEYNITATGN